MATMRSSIAVNELLLREAKECSSGSPVGMLSTSGGTESPARSTATLVLNGIDSTLCSPVYWSIAWVFLKDCWLSCVIDWVETQHLSGLCLGHGGEHVVSESVTVLLVIDGVDLHVHGLENS